MSELWSNALRRLSGRIASQNFDMWLNPIECRAIEGNTIRLRAPNQYVRLWFETNYLPIILDELKCAAAKDFEVEFEPDQEQPSMPPPTESHSGGSGFAPPMPASLSNRPANNGGNHHGVFVESASEPADNAPSAPQGYAGGGLEVVSPEPPRQRQPAPSEFDEQVPLAHLNPRYTFDTFVAGPSNQLAFAAAQAAASSYPPKYNPVFICGGVGLGKTHLLHAIGHHFQQTRRGARIMYMSGEQFMNEFIRALHTKGMHEFRRRYREGCDVLLVDDVQFLAGKDGTQDEFFHTFNALHDSHRQIVLTADRKPFEISDIADRLRTRFAWGLLADIEPPELEVRVAILRKKANAEGIHLPDDVALYIASAIKSNVRELEGALIRLAAYASLSRREINMTFAQETLEGSIARPREHLSVDSVIKAVAGYYGLKPADIKSARRHKSIAGPRAVAMYLARSHTKDSYPDLGRAFGGKHHTTVISAVEKIMRKLKDDPGLRGEVHAIESLILR